MFKFLGKLLDSNEKELARLRKEVAKINSFEEKMRKLKTDDFAKKTAEFKERISSSQALNDILPEAFALVREASRRTIGERHYDVQIVAALSLHKGSVAEQKTGEGKTLSATPALYLNALTGKGAHLVTVNDYLARRDVGWMGPIYHLLGLSVSSIINGESFIYDPEFTEESARDWRLRNLRPISRKEAYEADITYGINSEFGFDYLRDNMVSDISQTVQKGFHYAVVDEVDSVLIDEARTPHIISAPDTEPTQKYYDYARLVQNLAKDRDYEVDEKLRTAHLTDHGLTKVEKMLRISNIYEKDFETVHHIEAALKAKTLYQNERDYIVKDNEVIIVDEFTGRLLHGRRFSEGIHQAIEAKENVPIQRESKTLATVSLQNYFRMYEKLAGMTGTAATEAEEFHKIYSLDVVIIPTHKPMIRTDYPDSVYKTPRAKYAAIVRDISECYQKGQPVLIGTTSIDKNEIINKFLEKKGIPHNVLNAKNHTNEAMIITEAGKKGAVTVATNMAGRGVDIILGGSKEEKWEFENEKEWEEHMRIWEKQHKEIVELGGLHVIGSERHESRRIDNQLRGRSGRQGDPGTSRFYVSFQDDLMRIFGGDRMAHFMTIFKLPEDIPIEHNMVSKSIEQIQTKVEGFHFDTRKHLVEYDDVLNKQREIIYGRRRKILEGESQKEMIISIIEEHIQNITVIHTNEVDGTIETGKVMKELTAIIPFDPVSQERLIARLSTIKDTAQITQFLVKLIRDTYDAREKDITPEIMRQIEQWVSLQVIDNFWMDHLTAIEDLREGIGLRGYGQRDPLVEYKNEAFSMFERLVKGIEGEIVNRIFKVRVQLAPEQIQKIQEQSRMRELIRQARTNEGERPVISEERVIPQDISKTPNEIPNNKPIQKQNKIGRNDPCPCGAINPQTGKPYKYKKCGMINAPYHKG